MADAPLVRATLPLKTIIGVEIEVTSSRGNYKISHAIGGDTAGVTAGLQSIDIELGAAITPIVDRSCRYRTRGLENARETQWQ